MEVALPRTIDDRSRYKTSSCLPLRTMHACVTRSHPTVLQGRAVVQPLVGLRGETFGESSSCNHDVWQICCSSCMFDYQVRRHRTYFRWSPEGTRANPPPPPPARAHAGGWHVRMDPAGEPGIDRSLEPESHRRLNVLKNAENINKHSRSSSSSNEQVTKSCTYLRPTNKLVSVSYTTSE